MNDTDKRKTLYEEIFNDKKAPEVTTNNGNQEIKDAIDNKQFDNDDIVNLEDIFVFEDKNKKDTENEVKTSLESQPIKNDINNYSDKKYDDLLNNTLIDLKLDLENVSNNASELKDINLESLIKKDNDGKINEIKDEKVVNTEIKTSEIKPAVISESKTEKLDQSEIFENDHKLTENNSAQIETAKISKSTKHSSFWINYALVAALVALAIVSSLAFLLKQFK